MHGKIRVFGQDISKVDKKQLCSWISYVPQDSQIFDCSIAENIAYGSENVSMEEIEEAARLAQVDSFIRTLPKGYDTQVGEAGNLISGGQKQRIAIARAFIKNSPILLLDEATAALDAQTEREVNLAVKRLMEGRTVLVVAHRLSTVRDADQILVMEQGRIVETGDHDSLMERDGRYKELYTVSLEKKEGEE